MMGGMDTLKQNKFYAQKESAHQIVEDIMVLRESYRYALRVLKEDEAVYLTKNGYGSMVVLSLEKNPLNIIKNH